MSHLTYADRELLLGSFDSLRASWTGSDEQILAGVCSWAKEVVPAFGFEHALLRDITQLSRYVIDHSKDIDLANIARGGLLYVLRAGTDNPLLGRFGLADDAFIASYAVHEIRTRLGDHAVYNPPVLHKQEQDVAEQLFLEFLDRPLMEDKSLASAAHRVSEQLAGLAACGLFRRLRNHIHFLTSVLGDSRFTPEQISLARAGLGYIVCESDAIDDQLGIIGYLDDNFIAQLAVDLIEPAREPWLALLDATVGAWPFLNGMLIDDGTGGRPVSEYMIINSALACPQLRGGEYGSTALILPAAGPVPFLLGFVATLGLVQESGQRDVTEDSFRIGQKVLVDNSAVAEFAGFEDYNNRRLFKLRQHYTDRGQRMERIHSWPISDLRRLVPVDSGRVPRGQLTYNIRQSDAVLPALEYLFNASKSAHLASVARRTLLVMPVASAHELARTMTLQGQRLKEVIPIGHLTEEGVASWYSRFGDQEPLLIIASDLDAACRFAEERQDDVHLVIIDPQGRNANKAASLRRLQHLGIRTLVVAAERVADELPIDAGKTAIWEWSDDDFESLLWPSTFNGNGGGSGPISGYERRLQFRPSVRINTLVVPCDLADKAFEAVRTVRGLARARRDELLAELDEIVSISFGLLSRLLRCAFILTPATVIFQDAARSLNKIVEIRHRCNYLTGQERQAIADALGVLHDLFETLKVDNPKARAVRELTAAHQDVSIICPDKRLIQDLDAVYGPAGTCVQAGYSGDEATNDGAIIPGWFGKERMAALLMPPVTSPMHLVLYGIEQRWYAGFRRERQRARAARSAASARQQLFPNVSGWRKPDDDHPDEIIGAHDSSLQDLEAIQEYVRQGFRQRLCSSSRSDGFEAELPAWLVIFDGGTCAFLTEAREANVVTHLLDNAIDDPEAKVVVKRKSTSELKVGDALLFNRGSDRDVIRMAADEILEPGVRDTASLWRQALIEYTLRESLTSDQLHTRLRGGGCPLQHQTISNWLDNDQIIAPQAYKRDVAVVAHVTGDQRLAARMDSVLSAISEVRSAHLRASHQIAKQVLARAVNVLRDQGTSMIELVENVVIVRISEIDSDPVLVRASMCNRLLEGDAWHE
jgi:uncharacterized membrane protein YkvA (DUF1232 family)